MWRIVALDFLRQATQTFFSDWPYLVSELLGHVGREVVLLQIPRSIHVQQVHSVQLQELKHRRAENVC